MKSKVGKNIIFSFVGQLLLIVLGITVPRLMITNYGSDTNGLLNTIVQIFAYVALLESGIGQAAKNALYKPLAEKNIVSFLDIASAAQRYYRKITLFYAVAVLTIATIAPFIIKTSIAPWTVFVVVILEGMSGVITFFFVQTKTVILSVDGKGYVNNGVNVINKACGYIVKIVLAYFGVNIVLLQLGYFIITICKVLFYNIYFKSKYEWVVLSQKQTNATLKDRNAYVLTELAWTVFSSTDMIVLSIFINTTAASIYSVYNMVFANLNLLLNAVYNSVNYVLGQAYQSDLHKYRQLHDAYTSYFFGLMTVFMSVSYILIIPFISLYTRGVSDVNYINNDLPLLFCLVQMLSWSRYVSGNLTGLSGYAKLTSRISLIEAIINVGLSVILVNIWGMTGVLIATVVALPLKVFYCTYVAEKKVLKRSCKKTLGIWLANYLTFGIAVAVRWILPLDVTSYLSFVLYGFVFLLIFLVIGGLLNALANHEAFMVGKAWIRSFYHKEDDEK